jgi:hypothetical protein
MGKRECPICLQHTLHEDNHNNLWCENCGEIEGCPFCYGGIVAVYVGDEMREFNCIHCGGVGFREKPWGFLK